MISQRFADDGQAALSLSPSQREARDIVAAKLANGDYPQQPVPCLCGDSHDTLLAAKDRYGLTVHTQLCMACGQLRTSPRMTGAAYQAFYRDHYRDLYVGKEVDKEVFFANQFAHGEKIAEFLASHQVNFQQVLEIGCGAGGILQAFAEQGCDVVGLDLGTEYIAFGQQKGLQLLPVTSATYLANHTRRFDLIILSHVFEHFTDTAAELACIARLLKPGGMLYIEVPGVKNLHNSYECDFLRYLQNAHTYHFELATLQQELARHGFVCVAGTERVAAIFRYAPAEACLSPGTSGAEILQFLTDLEQHRDHYAAQLKARNQALRQQKIADTVAALQHYPSTSVAIYGNGGHTRLLLAQWSQRENLLGVIDPSGKTQDDYAPGVATLSLEQALARGVKALVLSSDVWQEAMYQRLRAQHKHIELVRIY